MAQYSSTTLVNEVLGPHATTATTTPTTAQLSNMIDGINAQIDSVLLGAGVSSVPVTSSHNASFAAFLIEVEKWGSAAESLKAMFPEATGPGETPAFGFWQKKYDDTLKAWRDGKDIPSTLLGGANDPSPSTYFTRNPGTEEVLGDLMEDTDRTRIGDKW